MAAPRMSPSDAPLSEDPYSRTAARSSSKPMKGVRVVVRGGGIAKSGTTNSKGVAVILVNPTKPGVITITAVDKGDPCGARRVGVVGVFLPPLTG